MKDEINVITAEVRNNCSEFSTIEHRGCYADVGPAGQLIISDDEEPWLKTVYAAGQWSTFTTTKELT